MLNARVQALAFIFIILLLSNSASAQVRVGTQGERANPLPPDKGISKDTKHVNCWGRNFSADVPRSFLVRSPVFLSPSGSDQAYVEVEATAFAAHRSDEYSGPLCANTSRLFVGRRGEAFRLVYIEESERSQMGNSLMLIDWSKDGTHILIERTRWQYESEGRYTDFLVFNVGFGVVTTTDLHKNLLPRIGSDCGYETSISGFTEEGSVIVAVEPIPADEIFGPPCVNAVTYFSLDLRQVDETAQPVPAGFRVTRYGKFSSAPREKK